MALKAFFDNETGLLTPENTCLWNECVENSNGQLGSTHDTSRQNDTPYSLKISS